MIRYKRVKPKGGGNPYLDPECHGRASEQRVCAELGGKLSLASGALECDKGDFSFNANVTYTPSTKFLVECKSTVKQSFSVKHSWLQKITKEAHEVDSVPLLTVSFVNEHGLSQTNNSDWVLVPLSFLQSIIAR